MHIINQLIIFHFILDAKFNDALPFSLDLLFLYFVSLNQKESIWVIRILFCNFLASAHVTNPTTLENRFNPLEP